MVSQTSSVTTIGTLSLNGQLYTLGVDQTTPFNYKVIPYLYKNSRVYISNRKNFEKCFPDKKVLIERYLTDHSIDFENLDDVTGLFEALTK